MAPALPCALSALRPCGAVRSERGGSGDGESGEVDSRWMSPVVALLLCAGWGAALAHSPQPVRSEHSPQPVRSEPSRVSDPARMLSEEQREHIAGMLESAQEAPGCALDVRVMLAKDAAKHDPLNCPQCARAGHETDAHYCRFCGSSLSTRDDQTGTDSNTPGSDTDGAG